MPFLIKEVAVRLQQTDDMLLVQDMTKAIVEQSHRGGISELCQQFVDGIILGAAITDQRKALLKKINK